MLTTRVGLLAVSMAESGIDPQGKITARPGLSQLANHVSRAGIHMKIMLHDQVQCLLIEDIRGVDNFWRGVTGGPIRASTTVAGRQGSPDFTGANRVDQSSLPADQVHDGQVGTRLLCKSNRIKLVQLSKPLDNRRRIIDVGRRTKLRSKISRLDSGNLPARGGKGLWIGHGSTALWKKHQKAMPASRQGWETGIT